MRNTATKSVSLCRQIQIWLNMKIFEVLFPARHAFFFFFLNQTRKAKNRTFCSWLDSWPWKHLLQWEHCFCFRATDCVRLKLAAIGNLPIQTPNACSTANNIVTVHVCTERQGEPLRCGFFPLLILEVPTLLMAMVNAGSMLASTSSCRW